MVENLETEQESFAVHAWGEHWAVGDGTYWVVVGVHCKEEAEEISTACKAGTFGLRKLMEISSKYAKE